MHGQLRVRQPVVRRRHLLQRRRGQLFPRQRQRLVRRHVQPRPRASVPAARLRVANNSDCLDSATDPNAPFVNPNGGFHIATDFRRCIRPTSADTTPDGWTELQQRQGQDPRVRASECLMGCAASGQGACAAGCTTVIGNNSETSLGGFMTGAIARGMGCGDPTLLVAAPSPVFRWRRRRCIASAHLPRKTAADYIAGGSMPQISVPCRYTVDVGPVGERGLGRRRTSSRWSACK